MVTHAIQFIVEDSEDDDEMRNELFAISGRMHEMATMVEHHAASISAIMKGVEDTPTLLPAEERERIKAIRREAEKESLSGGNGSGAEPH